MSDHDEEHLRPRPGRPAGGDGRRVRVPRRFTAEVIRVANSNRGGPPIGRAARKGVERGRGRVAARLLGDRAGARARRVMVKTRLVNLRKAAPGSTTCHLRYIERDGVTRSGAPGRAYGATDEVDVDAFADRSAGDRHQFRFIVSAEDGEALDDLQRFTRALMANMEADLGTKLDWLAVDHFDTDNPHSHIVVRGVDEAGADLVIARDYIAHGLRLRASEIATDWLGPQSEHALRAAMAREVDQERWTGLDRRLAAMQLEDGVIRLPESNDEMERFRCKLLAGRLQKLEQLGLAERTRRNGWQLSRRAPETLKHMGERGDIIRTMQRAFSGETRACALFSTGSVTGRIASKGLAEELDDRGYLIVDALDGRAHYVVLPPGADLAGFPEDAIVRVTAEPAAPRAADRTIAALADPERIYHVERHRLLARADATPGQDPETYVDTHVRRLEALRRAGAAERLDSGRWRLAPDFLDRTAAYEAGRFGGVHAELLSQMPIRRQLRAIGATWLDRALIDGEMPAAVGFGSDVRSALAARQAFLVEQGLAEVQGGRIRLVAGLLDRLRRREVDHVARRLVQETGLAHHPVGDGARVRGTYSRSLQLVSGRFAMIEDGLGFSLVPWRPVLENRLGQTIGGIMRNGSMSWQFGRGRGI